MGTLTVVNNTNNSNVVTYPTEQQITSNESVNVIVTAPHNVNIKAIENGNDITLNKLSNQVFTFEEQTITDGFGKGTMYHYGNPTIYTDDNGEKSVYMDGATVLRNDISRFDSSELTISFDFMLTDMNTTSWYYLFDLHNIDISDIHSSRYTAIVVHNNYLYWYDRYDSETDTNWFTITSKTISNDTWYNLTYCICGNINYVFIDGVKITEFTREKIYDGNFIDFFANTKYYNLLGFSKGYIKNIVLCNSCIYTTDFQLSEEPINENNFSGEYSVYNCTNESIFNVPYINNDLLKFEILSKLKVNNIFYTSNNSIYMNRRYGMKLTPKNTTSNFTISFWYEATEDMTQYNRPMLIYFQLDNEQYFDICLNRITTSNGTSTSNNKISIEWHNSSNSLPTNYWYDTLEYTIILNQKYHILVEFDGTSCNLYINGVLIKNRFMFSKTANLLFFTIGCNDKNDNTSSYLPNASGNYGNINFINETINKGLYPTNYPIEDIYKYTATLTLSDDINIEILKKLPILSFNQITRNKISSILGFDSSVAEFTSDTDLTEWEARATVEGQPYGHGIGTLVDGGTTLSANETATVTIDDEELTNGDVEYRISVYGKDANGVWSDE